MIHQKFETFSCCFGSGLCSFAGWFSKQLIHEHARTKKRKNTKVFRFATEMRQVCNCRMIQLSDRGQSIPLSVESPTSVASPTSNVQSLMSKVCVSNKTLDFGLITHHS